MKDFALQICSGSVWLKKSLVIDSSASGLLSGTSNNMQPNYNNNQGPMNFL